MITPEWLSDELNLLNTHKALQESILRDIVRRIIKTDFTVTDTAAWQAEKLQQSGMVFDEIAAEVAKMSKKSTSEIKKAFADAKTEVFNYGDDEIEKAGYDVKEFKKLSPAMNDIITAAVKKTTTEAKNLTKTTALTSQSAYINAADLAHQQVKSGAFTLDEALANAIRSAADGGFTVIYPSGHKSSLDAAMRRALLTGLNQTTCKIAEMRADEVGSDLMEISAHFGARPSHAEWQGQIVSRIGRKGYLSLDDIGYGKVDGFMGANCRHDWWVFFEGLSKPRYTEKQLNEYKNATVEYDGQKMPMYEARQKQRSMERKVRTLKQRLVAYDEAAKNVSTAESISAYRAAFDREAQKLKSAEAKIQDFCNRTGIARQKTLEQVFATETVNGAKGFGRSVSSKAVWGNKNLDFIQNDAIIKKKSGLPKVIKSPDEKLSGTSNVDFPGIHSVVPKGAVLENVHVIAGYGTSVPLRDVKRLHYTHKNAGAIQKWQKKVGTVKGDNYSYEIHWYSNGSYVPPDDIKTARVRK